MSILDARGWFHGDRIGRCSDLAQLLWGRFMVASNGYARLKLDYDEFCKGPLASLKKRPTLREISEVFREYRDNHLAFLYQSDGAIWAQFECPERFLPRHKNSADKRSPCPPAEELAAWRDSYADSKGLQNAQEFSKLLRNAPKSAETFGKLPIGVGGGVGEGKGKIPAAPAAENGLHYALQELIRQVWLGHNPNVPTCPWDGREGKRLQALIGKTPRWSIEMYAKCLEHYYASDGTNSSVLPYQLIGDLPKYLNGPLDQYGHAKGNGNGTNRKSDKLAETLRAIDEA